MILSALLKLDTKPWLWCRAVLTGLKYRSRMILHSLFAVYTSLQISSMKSLVRPYGLAAPVGNSSVAGTVLGWPYTVADDENTSCTQKQRDRCAFSVAEEEGVMKN